MKMKLTRRTLLKIFGGGAVSPLLSASGLAQLTDFATRSNDLDEELNIPSQLIFGFEVNWDIYMSRMGGECLAGMEQLGIKVDWATGTATFPEPIDANHNSPGSLRIKKDGDQFCATRPDFINLQESPAGFGPTEPHAILDLLINEQ